ncbi:anti-phage ZorAB system protein ZorA [Benzoatithermus flavus]|uniref:Anti-phage ZorAB system protein ZorA n=1 Tax=Benzoatithermus flavus TaxID=3108223 RepID=A0ABU8XKL5_9PROT
MLQIFAPIVSHPLTIATVSAALILWALISGQHLVRRTRALKSALDRERQRIEASGDAAGFAAAFEELRDELGRDELLGLAWRDYAETLLLPREPGRIVHSTVRPSTWFNLDLCRRADIDLRYHAALPNLLVGAGLLFTFLGLAVALDSAGGLVAAGADQRNDALKTLLDTASFKFVTSLIGLAASIGFAFARKYRLHAVEKALDGFTAALEARAPLITPALLQQETIRFLDRQTAQLESFSNDLAVSLGSAVDAAFDQRLGEHIGPLVEVLERLADRVGTSNEEAMRQMIDAFVGRLEGGTGDHMEKVAASLTGLGAGLERLQAGLGGAAERMAEAADAMARRMGEGAEAALGRITDQMANLVETLRQATEQTRDAGADAARELARRMEAAAVGFETAAQGVSATLAEAARAMADRMGSEAEASSARLARQLEAMLATLNGLAETSRATGTAALDLLAERMAAATAALEATARQVAEVLDRAAVESGGALQRGADEAAGRLAQAVESLRGELQTMLGEMRGALGATTADLLQGTSDGARLVKASLAEAGDGFVEALAQAAGSLRSAGEEAGQALRGAGSEAAGRIVAAGGVLDTGARQLDGQTTRLAAAIDGAARQLTALEQAALAAATPLAGTARDLATAGTAVREALQPLAESGRRAADATERLGGVAHRVESLLAGVKGLTDEMGKSAGRFAGIDTALANTVMALKDGLKGFTDEVGRFVNQTNKDMAQAATHLDAAIRNLEETLQDLTERLPAPAHRSR